MKSGDEEKSWVSACQNSHFSQRRQKLSPLIDRINDRYGRCAIGFGLMRPASFGNRTTQRAAVLNT